MERFNSAIILAGGKSSRMGFNKELIRVDKKRLVDCQVEALKKVFDEIIVVTRNEELYRGNGVKAVKDILAEKGPLGGIHAGLEASSSMYSYVIACDMPVINTDYINYMKKILYSGNRDGCMALYGDHIEPFNAFYSKDIKEAIESYVARGEKSIYGLVKSRDFLLIDEMKVRKFSPNWDMFINFNTREDISKYLGNGSSD